MAFAAGCVRDVSFTGLRHCTLILPLRGVPIQIRLPEGAPPLLAATFVNALFGDTSAGDWNKPVAFAGLSHRAACRSCQRGYISRGLEQTGGFRRIEPPASLPQLPMVRPTAQKTLRRMIPVLRMVSLSAAPTPPVASVVDEMEAETSRRNLRQTPGAVSCQHRNIMLQSECRAEVAAWSSLSKLQHDEF
ncbi:unnamed protein product [Gongylonema pulchrum]|uniref:DUF3778 domain-containing protein n=1 Tax=Gongylonema pulchrum TaxID=637853 RepID=A0A183DVE7_9BILA|nr:unnamed protein product [Gongylonema pulchrum]